MQSQTATAHPKFDPVSGDMLSHGYEARGLATRDVALQVIAASGALVREEFFLAPYVSFMHDWAVSAQHLVFPLMPTICELERLRAGGAHWVFEPERECAIGIMRRDASVRDLRWFRAPACGIGHILNAFSDGERVHVDLFISERNQFPFIANADGQPFDRARSTPRLTRWSFDLGKPGDGFESRTLFRDFMEMPATDPRYQTQPYRHGFAAIVDATQPLNVAGTIGVGWNTIAHLDLATGGVERYYVGGQTTCQEPCFVPRSARAPEGDGFLLSVLNRFDGEPRSELAVFDALHVAAGPIASVRLPFRLRGAVHGCWVAAGPAPA
jgi:carotenoid cleavage dioxygenase